MVFSSKHLNNRPCGRFIRQCGQATLPDERTDPKMAAKDHGAVGKNSWQVGKRCALNKFEWHFSLNILDLIPTQDVFFWILLANRRFSSGLFEPKKVTSWWQLSWWRLTPVKVNPSSYRYAVFTQWISELHPGFTKKTYRWPTIHG